MHKKKAFLFLLILLFLVFFLIYIFYTNSQTENIVRESNETSSNSLNLGPTESNLDPTVIFCPENNCEQLIISLIRDSNKTIDCAIYDITSKEVSDALISEKRQGTKIRIVTDKGRAQTKSTVVGILKSSGIDVLISPSESSYMHNKFCVFDGNIALIGSANFTNNSFFGSYNNILVFENPKLAQTLTEKIDSFYLGNFSKSSSVLGETISENLSVDFCPSNNCKEKIINEIISAKNSILCMMYSFTLDDVSDAMIDAKEKGVDVKVILESQQTSQYSEYEKLKVNDIAIIEDNDSYLMHNKYCVFDEMTVTTGSMNFSTNGINNNDEILLVAHDQNISKRYSENFKNYWNTKAN